MESIYTELAFYGITNECARTDNIISPVSKICDGTVSLIVTPYYKGVGWTAPATPDLLMNCLALTVYVWVSFKDFGGCDQHILIYILKLCKLA